MPAGSELRTATAVAGVLGGHGTADADRGCCRIGQTRSVSGHRRLQAYRSLERLGRDTVEAVIWDMNEADAVR